MTQTAPSATLNDLTTAAVASYGGANAPAMGSQWQPIDVAPANSDLRAAMDAKGFYGQAYVNSQTGEVIIADRGTIGNVQNLISDAQIAVTAFNGAQSIADNFATAALAAAQTQLSLSGVTVSVIYTTGHSLGGAESQGQAAMLSVATNPDGTSLVPSGVKITNVSIDAPGIAGLSTSGNSNNYTSYNFSAQGDLVNLAGGNNLAGTTSVSLAIGPSMWATGGMVGLGTAMQAVPGVGAVLGGATIAAGLSNALDAHSSVAFLNGISGTALGNTQMSQLSGKSAAQIQTLFGVTQPVSGIPVYDAAGYDQNGYSSSGYNIYGVDRSGNLDPSIATQGGRTNTDMLSDGSKVTVVIAQDGSATETLNDADGTIYTYNRNATGQLVGATTQGTDGTILNQAIDQTTGVITQSETTGSGAIQERGTIQANQDGSASTTSVIYNSAGQKSTSELEQKAGNGTSSETDINYNNDVAQGQVVINESATGQAITATVTGSGSSVDLTGATINFAAGSQSTLTGNDNTVMAGANSNVELSSQTVNNIVTMAANGTVVVDNGAQCTVINAATVSAGNNTAVTVEGTGTTITAGTSSTINVASNSNNDVVTVGANGTVSVADGDHGTIIDASSAGITLGNNISATINGSGDRTAGGGNDVVTQNGSGTANLGAGSTITETANNAQLVVAGDNLTAHATGQGDTLETMGNHSLADTSGNNSFAITTGANSEAHSSGDHAMAETTGYGSLAETTGVQSEALTIGGAAMAITTGYGSLAQTIGNGSEALTTGDAAEAFTTGYGSLAQTSGNGSEALTTGGAAEAFTTGYGSLAQTIGNGSEALTIGGAAEAYTTGYGSLAQTTGNGSEALTNGGDAEAYTTGYGSLAETTGNGSEALADGGDAAAVTTGYGSLAEATGNGSEALTTGDDSEAYTTGYGSFAETEGGSSPAVSTGGASSAETGGQDSAPSGAPPSSDFPPEDPDFEDPCPDGEDPIILNLKGSKVQTTSLSDSGTYFDMQNNGQKVQTGWATAGEGVLVYDPNNTGTVTDDANLVAGFGALSTLANQSGGVLDASNSIWDELKVWVDPTGDANFQQGQLYSLSQLGISSIDLNSTVEQINNNGNTILNDSTFTWNNGTTGDIAGVNLAFNPNAVANSVSAANTNSTLSGSLNYLIQSMAAFTDGGNGIDAVVSSTGANADSFLLAAAQTTQHG